MSSQMRDAALAIDVGATKIAVGLVARDGALLVREDIVSQVESLDKLNQSLADVIRRIMLQTNLDISVAGIGSAGPIDRVKGLINPVNIGHWVDFSLVDFVREVSGISQVRLVGDASALTYAEFQMGAGIDAKNLLGIVISTGIGGGVVLNGQFYEGRTGNAGLIGHSVVVADGKLCACGQRGCVEAYSSGTNMAKDFGVDSFEAVAIAARTADARAIAVVDEGARKLAIGLLNAVALLDIDTIVVGGGVMNAADIYWPVLQRHFATQMKVLNLPGEVALKRATLGADSGIVGAGLVGFSPIGKGE